MTSSGNDETPAPGEGSSDDIDTEFLGDGAPCCDEKIREFLDNAKEGAPIGTDETLGAVAKKTVEKAEISKTLIEDLQEHLRSEPAHGKIRRFHVPPGYEDVFAGATLQGSDRNWFVQTADWFKKTVDRYSNGTYDPAVVDQDILKLQAQMVYFSSWVNHFDGVATDAESTMKQAQSRAFIEGRQWLETQELDPRAVSMPMLNAIAVEAVQDRNDWHTTASVTSETIKGFYYALKDFIMYLDRVSQRAQPDRMAGRRHA